MRLITTAQRTAAALAMTLASSAALAWAEDGTFDKNANDCEQTDVDRLSAGIDGPLTAAVSRLLISDLTRRRPATFRTSIKY